MAQLTVPPAVRGGPGASDVISPSVVIPAGMTSISLTYSMPQADRDNVNATIWQRIEVSLDNQVTWKAYMDGGNWRGGSGAFDRSGTILNPAPSMQLSGPSLAALVGKHTRGRWEIPVAITIGMTITAV